MLGVLCTRPKGGEPPRKQRWEVSLGYRFLPSFRHFVGTEEQEQREILGNQIVNHVHIWDLGVSYQVNPRWSVYGSIPVIRSWRNQLYVPRGEFTVLSQGDATVGVRRWLFRPPTESRANLGVGVGIKIPAGRFGVTGAALDRNGRPVQATADQSIQPGDGGVGMALDLNGYTPGPLQSWLYVQGTYLVNPRNTNGVNSFRTRAGEEVLSVADQYLLRAGMTRTIPGVRRMAFSMGYRIEGVAVRDLIGGSDGFRRPGYAASIDPGLLFSWRSYTFSVNAPWAVARNRQKSTTDLRNNFHGDAAFADYSILIGVSKRF